MKEYVKIVWKHDIEDEPTLIYLELDSSRFNTRIIELYKNGKYGFAGENQFMNNAKLAEEAFPSVEDYNRKNSEEEDGWEDDLLAFSIQEEEFNILWNFVLQIKK